MTVLVPYTPDKLDPRTVRLIEQHTPDGHEVRWAELDPRDERAYARLLIDAWGRPGDLIVIEHDIGIRAGVIEELTACSQPWCGFPYAIGGNLLVCLGCTRFTHTLKTALPDLMREAAAIGPAQDGGGVAAGDWRRLDVRVGACLERLGHARHRHEPEVEHYHHYEGSQP